MKTADTTHGFIQFNDGMKTYEIDYDKVNSIDDLKTILKALSFTFRSANIDDFKDIKHLLIEKLK